MANRNHLELSRRERQIMEALFRIGRASVAAVRDEIPDPPSYSAVRTMLGVLHEKRQVRREKDGRRYVYLPVVTRERAQRSAVRNLLRTFFDDSIETAVASLLDHGGRDLDDDELARIEEMIEQARKGKKS